MWHLEDQALDNTTLLNNESLFTLANGYLGIRGNFEEGYPDDYKTIRGAYINAFYDIINVKYAENAYGYPKIQQKLVNIIDAQGLKIYLDGELVSVFNQSVSNYKRNLYFDKGYSERVFEYITETNKLAKIIIKRLVSFEVKELFAIELNIEYDGMIKIISTVSGDVANYADPFDPRINHGSVNFLDTKVVKYENDYTVIVSSTKESKLDVCCVSKDVISKSVESFSINQNHSLVDKIYEIEGNVTFTKYNIFTDSRRHPIVENSGISIMNEVLKVNFKQHLSAQETYLNNFWKYGDIEIIGDEYLQQGLRFNVFHLLQSIGKDSHTNISAKGLTGEGYEGHYFWDTEIYIFPVFLMINPDLARNLLMYRYNTLDEAKKRAIEMGHKKGVLFPWRTITGPECSTYFPAGTAQYHINADIAYSFINYYLMTEDFGFIEDYGAEVLFETARLYADLGNFKDGKYYINTVTGPDEYTAIVNNNYYTNVMAKFNLNWAINIYTLLKNKKSQKLEELKDRLQLTEEEIQSWGKISSAMYLIYDEELEINPQDDSFLNKAVWDFKNTPKDNYPLLLHYHPLTIYRFQVCKQADTVLAHFLLEDEVKFNTIKNSYHYYEKVTTHDSSLSSCIFSIMASKINELEKAYNYFIETARLDLDNTHGNTKDGLHMANMGGTWMAIVYGFAGLRIKQDGIHLTPNLPKKLGGYSFYIRFKNNVLRVVIKEAQLTLFLVEGEEVEITLYGKLMKLKYNETYECQLEY